MENNTKQESLRLVDGKFMRGGFEVAPVIGDREQIALLHAEERSAFASLIDKVSGRGTWESNPWVFVYEFELLR